MLSITHRGRAVSAAEPAAGTADLLGPLPHDQLDRDEGVDADGQDQGQEDVDGCRGSARFFLRLMINLEDLTITRKTLLESFHFRSTYQVKAIGVSPPYLDENNLGGFKLRVNTTCRKKK